MLKENERVSIQRTPKLCHFKDVRLCVEFQTGGSLS